MLFFTLINIAHAAENPLEDLLEPMRGFNIAEAYAVHSHFIDFVIYVFIFVSLAKITIGERFKGRQGNILSGVIGVALAVSLAVTEYKLGFSIRSFGPIAGFIILLLVGYVFYKVIFQLTGGRTGSVAIAFLGAYFLIRAISPVLFNWLADKVPFINFILGVAVIISVWYAASLFVRKPNTSLGTMGSGFTHGVKKAADSVKEFVSEGRIVKARLGRITKKQRKKSNEVMDDLKDMGNVINEHGNSAYGRKLITQKLQDIIPKEHDLINKLAYLKNLNDWLKSFDLNKFKELKERYDVAPETKKRLIKKEILEEREKLNIEQKIDEIELDIKKYQEDFNYYLNIIVSYLNAGKVEEAKNWLPKAIACEKKTTDLLKKMQTLEKLIFNLTKVEIKQEKQEELF